MPAFAAEVPSFPMIIVNSILGVATFDLPIISVAELSYYGGSMVNHPNFFDLGERDYTD